jgi:hypothetical protein
MLSDAEHVLDLADEHLSENRLSRLRSKRMGPAEAEELADYVQQLLDFRRERLLAVAHSTPRKGIVTCLTGERMFV